MRTRNRPPLWLLAAPVVGALALGIVSVGVSVSGGDGGWYGIAAAALYAVAVVVTWLWDRPRRRSDSLRVRHDPTPHPVDLWLDDPDEHDGHLVAVIGEGQRPDPGPPPASVFPRSSDGQGGGPMPPPGHLHTSRLGDEDDWCDGARRAGDAFAAEVLKARAEVDRAAWGLPARGRVFPVCLSTAPLPGAGPIAEAAGPVEIVLPPESCDADGWPKYTIFRAPDGTTRTLRHVGGGVYEETTP